MAKKKFLNTITRLLEAKLGAALVASTNTAAYERILELLSPGDNGVELVRVGASSDGGYLVPLDLSGIELCISPGVAANWQFESQLMRDYGIESLMLDASIQEPKLEFGLHFRRTWIGESNGSNRVSINSLVSDLSSRYGGDLLLQMDIEGAEYLALAAVDVEVLKRFRIIVVEFHDLELWKVNSYASKIVIPLLERLSEIFDVVHIHPNNGGLSFYWHGQIYPSGVEVTFHRKDRGLKPLSKRKIPHHLDAACDPTKTDMEFIIPSEFDFI